ncbi:hypothetical protein MRX96_016572 [Rhipicephalus microplus]
MKSAPRRWRTVMVSRRPRYGLTHRFQSGRLLAAAAWGAHVARDSRPAPALIGCAAATPTLPWRRPSRGQSGYLRDATPKSREAARRPRVGRCRQCCRAVVLLWGRTYCADAARKAMTPVDYEQAPQCWKYDGSLFRLSLTQVPSHAR